MKLNSFVHAFLMGSAVVLSSHVSFASALSELSAADQAKVENGEQVAVFTPSDMPGAPWPICKVYQWVNATPEEAIAVFTDFELQKSYIPDLAKSQITKREKNSAVVDYTVNLPMNFGSESYTATDTITTYDGGLSYMVKWTVTPTKSIKMSEGNARFEAIDSHKGKGTLISYNSFIYPIRWGSSMGWVVDRSKKVVQDTLTAIIGQIGKEKQGSPDLINKQIKELRDSLAQ